MKLSGVVITLNEEQHIGRCLASMKGVVDEIIVVDSHSSDRTVEICESYGARVRSREFTTHIDQKNYAVSLASHELILYLDADEALSPELKKSITEIKRKRLSHHGYSMNRKSHYCGKWLKYAWYPDKKIRLWARNQGIFDGENPHDRVTLINGTSTHLNGDILHYSYESLQEHRKQMSNYVEIAAKAKYKSGKRTNLLIHMILGPFFKFIRLYFFKGGMLDGYLGFSFSLINAQHNFEKYRRLRELQLNDSRSESGSKILSKSPRESFR